MINPFILISATYIFYSIQRQIFYLSIENPLAVKGAMHPIILTYVFFFGPRVGRGRGDGGYVRQTSYEESRGEGAGGFGRGMDSRRQGWNETRLVILCFCCCFFFKPTCISQPVWKSS